MNTICAKFKQNPLKLFIDEVCGVKDTSYCPLRLYYTHRAGQNKKTENSSSTGGLVPVQSKFQNHSQHS